MNEDNEYQFYLEGNKYQQNFLNLIESAQESICLQTYIFKLDHFGTKVYECLLKKAKQGILVNLVIDYIGSYQFDPKLKLKLTKFENFNVIFFNPITTPKILQIGRRLHHKILIVDQTFAIIGGINITEGKKAHSQDVPKLDFAIKVKSKSIKALYQYCMQISHIVKKGAVNYTVPEININQDHPIAFHYNDWVSNRKQITSRYLSLIKHSSNTIYLIHGYFFPSFRIINHLINKSRQGVKVVLILPKYSDWQTWVWATEYLYSKLIKNGIDIFEWKLSQLHGKLAIFDDETILVGSYNLNYTSSYGNLEMNIEIKDQNFVKKIMQHEMKYILTNSTKLDLKSLSNWTWLSKLRNFFCYLLLLAVSTLSINWIKASRHLKNMTMVEKTILLILVIIGFIGIVLPFIPGVPFLLVAIGFMIKKRDGY